MVKLVMYIELKVIISLVFNSSSSLLSRNSSILWMKNAKNNDQISAMKGMKLTKKLHMMTENISGCLKCLNSMYLLAQ